MTEPKKQYAVDIKDKCFNFSISLLSLLKEIDKSRMNVILIDQLTRSGTSIGANVNESQASSTRKELTRYYRIALKSAYETTYWLKILSFFEKANITEFEKLINETEEIRRILSAIILKLKENPN